MRLKLNSKKSLEGLNMTEKFNLWVVTLKGHLGYEVRYRTLQNAIGMIEYIKRTSPDVPVKLRRESVSLTFN